MAILEFCREYFNVKKGAKYRNLKIFSYFISFGILPISLLIVYAGAAVYARYNKSPSVINLAVAQPPVVAQPAVATKLSDSPPEELQPPSTMALILSKQQEIPSVVNKEPIPEEEIPTYLDDFLTNEQFENLLNEPRVGDHGGWVTQNHIDYYLDYLRLTYNKKIFIEARYNPARIHADYDLRCAVLEDLSFNQAQPKDKQKSLFMYRRSISRNHYTLLIIDNDQKTLEYYDSLVSYGNYSNISAELKKLASELSKKYKANYQFIPKIKKSLQQGPDCGIWLLYFAENRLKNPKIDFNNLDPKPDMNEYRLEIRQTLAKALLSGEPAWVKLLPSAGEKRKPIPKKLSK